MEPPIVQVVGPTDQWILERLARRLAAKLPYARFVAWAPQRNAPPGLAYYVNYALYQGPTPFIDVGFFTHRDDNRAFLERARTMEFSVCMSRVDADWLREQGIMTEQKGLDNRLAADRTWDRWAASHHQLFVRLRFSHEWPTVG